MTVLILIFEESCNSSIRGGLFKQATLMCNSISFVRIPIIYSLQVMGKTHYYIVDPSGITKGTAVSKLDFKVMPDEPFQVEGLEVSQLPR